MPPQEPQIPEEGTPAPTTPEAPESTENWQERYANLQPEYTRATQEAAQLRQQLDSLRNDPEAQSAFLQELGLEVIEEESEPELDGDQLAALRKEFDQRLAPVEQTITQAEQERQNAALDNHFESAFAKFGKARGLELDADEKAQLLGLALTLPAAEGQLMPGVPIPPVDQAWEIMERSDTAKLERWAKSKRTTHKVSPSGAAGTEQPDLSTHEGRVAYAMGRLAE